MSANKYKIVLNPNIEKELTLSIQNTWDFEDRGDSLVQYEENVINEIINGDKDFEVVRFSPKEYFINNKMTSEVNYEFYFVPEGADINNTTWVTSYVTQGFSLNEIYQYSNSFKKSFFKLDLYDSTNLKIQKNYITIVLPVQQGEVGLTNIMGSQKQIKTPKFKLDYIGNKEGLFVYWLKNRDYINLDTFYMTAKFFDAKRGIFIKMMNTQQSLLLGNMFSFPQEDYFYYKVSLDYTDFTYKIYNLNDNPVGDYLNPIKWYEYINP